MKQKKIFPVICAFLMAFCAAACSEPLEQNKEPGPSEGVEQEFEREFDNIILVIGDGMGENHILNALTYFDLDTPAFMQDQVGFIYTNSLSGVTDSAAGGTALATGKKVYNGNVAQLYEENLQQITTIAQKAGMKTGIVTTDGLNGATPAAFSAHAPDRDLNSEILRTQAQSGINLLLGQSSSAALTHYDYFTSAGYQFKLVRKNFQTTLDSYKGEKKFAGVLSEVGSQYIKGCESHYQLKDMAKYAVEFLENEKGFFLMVEGAYIDKYSEKNNLDSALSEVRSLIDTIEYLYEYAADGRTAIFITADHETGGLQKATSKASMSNSLYTTNVHTIKSVPLYVKNYSLDLTKFGYEAGATPENTVVFEACKSIING